MVNEIVTQLMTQTSGEAQARMTNLSNTSLPALRAYLDGQSRLRRGDAQNAAKDFDRALDEDSTFALAGLGLRLATSWYGDPQLGDRGIRAAWRERARLSARDQALLTALAGPHYPARSSNVDLYKAREQYLSLVPDNAEAWYLLADETFHYGSAMGIPDWEERSLAGFKKAMELDSTYLPGYTHAMPLAPSMGDTAFLTRALRLRTAGDTSTQWRVLNDWYLAAKRGDNAAAASVFQKLGPAPAPVLNGIIRHMVFDGTGARQAREAIERFVALSPTEAEKHGRSRYAHDVMLILGRPSDALKYLELSRDSANDLNIPVILLRDASMGLIDERYGVEAAQRLARIDAAPEPTDATGKAVQRVIIRAMEPWRIARGDTTQTRRSVQRLRSIARTVPADDALNAELEIAFIEMLAAQQSRSASFRSSVERVDSLLMLQDFGAATPSRLAQQTIFAAKAWESLGDVARAESMIARYPIWNGENEPYLGLQLREQGRIAAKAGDRKRAIRAYRQYLSMNVIAEPSSVSQIDSVRRELAKVEAETR
jgi:tetratricopeptide (TPR) repeat protein